MKSLSFLSLLLMASMFLFLGGCQRDEALLDSLGNSVGANGKMDSLSLKKFTLPDESNFITKGRSGGTAVSYDSLSKICDLILQQNSTNHFLLQFIQSNGYPAWEKAFEFGEKRGSAKIIGIPFVKDGKVKGVLQYYSIFGDLGLTYFSSEAADYTIKLADEVITDIDKTSILYHIIAQTKCSGISDSLLVDWYLGHLSMFTDASGLRVRNCQIYCGTAEFTYINDGATITATGNGCVEICYEVPGFISHSQGNFIISTGSNWWQNNWTGSSGQGNGGDTDKDEIQKEEESRKEKELAECIASQSDAETEAMLDEALKDVEFPCKNPKETVMTKNMTKDLVKEAWCKEQTDNPGPLQPDGTHLKPKMTAADIQNAVNKALDGVDYVDNNITNNRLKCLWDKLINSNNNVICEQIDYYQGKTKLNLSIWSQEFVGVIQDNASTGIDDNGQVTIQFNENNLLGKCDIEIIKTMIHESVHAGILNIVKGTHLNGWGVNDVPDLKYYYDNFTNFHHEYMAGSYFKNLVQSLKQYFGSEYTDEEYEAIMWSGLHNTSTYKKLPEAKRNSIEGIWEKFKNSTTCKKSCI